MANPKLLLPILTELVVHTFNVSHKVTESTKLIKESLQNEILSITIKLFFGLILTSVIIFSLISVGQLSNNYFLTLENGMIVSITVFTLVAIGGSVGLRFLLKSRMAKKETSTEELLDVNIQLLLTNFLQGVADGMEQAAAKNQEVREHSQETVSPSHLSH